MLWAALLPPSPTTDESRRIEALSGLATWALQFTPRVAVVEPASASPAVVLEVEASVRLFGGRRRLAERVHEALDLGVRRVAWAPTSLGAVALARADHFDGITKPLAQLLDPLPLEAITAVAKHQDTLAKLGCRTLGQVRAFPRGGISQRFGEGLLDAIDQAYGQLAEVHSWWILPEVFQARLELMARVEVAPALLFGARRLLVMLCGWLAARHSGVTAFTLKWWHDVMRSRAAGSGGELTIRTAHPTRDIEHLTRLLSEHLAKIELAAPAGDLELVADEVTAIEEKSFSLLPDEGQTKESLNQVLERIAARLGPASVLRPVFAEDHRLEWMCHWHPSNGKPPRPRSRWINMPQPTHTLPEPLRLATRGDRPLYHGALLMLTGPHRVEGGWWHRVGEGAEVRTTHVARDYWVAVSEHAGVLWVFQARLADDQTAWFLHGIFA